MTFDLHVFDTDEMPEDDGAVCALLGDDSGWGAPLTPALAGLVAELEAGYPGLRDDPDNSPWACWPLTQSAANGTCCTFNIRWDAAEAVSREII